MKRIAITGAAGQIAYSLIFRAAHGDLFPTPEPISLHLCDLPEGERALEGVAMELEDCAFPLLREIKIGTDPHQLFKEVDIALLIGAKPRGPGMERGDLLLDNGRIFVDQGRALNDVAKKDAKVFVVGNPCNTNCLITMNQAPNLLRKNFHAMMRLDENRALYQLSKKAKVKITEVTRMAIWGNHSTTQVPDFTQAFIKGESALKWIDREWLQNEFVENVQKRGAEIIRSRGKSSAASAASALVDAVRSLYEISPANHWFTSAVCTDTNPYGIEKNLVFGFPCRSKGNGDYEIVPDLALDFWIKEKIAVTQAELISERDCVKQYLEG